MRPNPLSDRNRDHYIRPGGDSTSPFIWEPGTPFISRPARWISSIPHRRELGRVFQQRNRTAHNSTRGHTSRWQAYHHLTPSVWTLLSGCLDALCQGTPVAKHVYLFGRPSRETGLSVWAPSSPAEAPILCLSRRPCLSILSPHAQSPCLTNRTAAHQTRSAHRRTVDCSQRLSERHDRSGSCPGQFRLPEIHGRLPRSRRRFPEIHGRLPRSPGRRSSSSPTKARRKGVNNGH